MADGGGGVRYMHTVDGARYSVACATQATYFFSACVIFDVNAWHTTEADREKRGGGYDTDRTYLSTYTDPRPMTP